MSVPKNQFQMQPAEPVERVETWTRRKTETKRAWDGFCIFRDSSDRKLATVAKALNCSVPNIARWSSMHAWQQRALDYDNHIDEQHLAEIARNRVSARARRIKIAQALQALGAHALREWQARVEQGLPLNLPVETIALLSKTGAQLEKDATGSERGSNYMKVNVIFRHKEDDPEPPNAADEKLLLEGETKLKPN